MWEMWTLNNQCPLKDQCKQIPSQIQTNTLSYTNIKQTYFPNNKEVFVSETPWATPATTGRCTTGTNLSITSGTGTSEVADFFLRFFWSFRHFNILGLLQIISFQMKSSGTGEGPRASACAFWNEFMPMLRKENRTGGHCQ